MKLFPNFTGHHVIAHTNIKAQSLMVICITVLSDCPKLELVFTTTTTTTTAAAAAAAAAANLVWAAPGQFCEYVFFLDF